MTGPFENPVRRWVRLREKARQFNELPPPRKVPVAKPSRRKDLQAVEGVPRVSPEVLEKRLQFLLSPAAVQQQLHAPLDRRMSPATTEWAVWERQMREVRRVYRAQYLQKLAEVTELERQKEAELHALALAERRRRKQAHLQRVGEDMKRRAILKDRRRIEGKVTEAMEMARKSKSKRLKLFWMRRMEKLSNLIVSATNVEEAFGAQSSAAGTSGAGAGAPASASTAAGSVAPGTSSSGVLVSRNVSVPFMLRQLGGARGFPQQKTRRIPRVENLQREVLELSYDIMPEDAPRFEAPTSRSSARERAAQLYSGFTKQEQLALLDQKIAMLEEKVRLEEAANVKDSLTIRLREELKAARLVFDEHEVSKQHKEASRDARGEDPPGLPPRGGVSGGS